MVKMYFGRQPQQPFVELETVFTPILIELNYDFEAAVDKLVAELPTDQDIVYWTMNPLIPNFMEDDVAKDLWWLIDEHGNHFHMGEDDHILEKLTRLGMGPGDALCDDARSFL